MEGNSGKLKKAGIVSLFWVVLALLIISGSTYAWFTFSSHTNVTPMAGTIGKGGIELLISDSEDGPFDTECPLPVEGATENMQPVSTADLSSFFEATTSNSQGISGGFVDVTDTIGEKSLSGTIYLKVLEGDCDVYLDRDAFNVTGDAQMLAAARLGIRISGGLQEESVHIFSLDDYVTSDVDEADTMTESGVVIASVDGAGNADLAADPATSLEPFFATVTESTQFPGEEVLIHMTEEETVRIDYRIYIEGCDENATVEAQEKEISLNLAFAGIGQ